MKPLTMLPLALALALASTAHAQQQKREQSQTRDPSTHVTAPQSQEVVYGWELMNEKERQEYQARMRSLRTDQEREALRAEHHKQMQERAKAQGKTLPDMPPPGAGPGQGKALGYGKSQGQGKGAGPGAAQSQTQERAYGWELMSDKERREHQDKMRSLQTEQEREVFRTEHHKQMQERAKAQGKTLPDMPRQGSGAGKGPAKP